MAFKMVIYILVSIMVIFILIFRFTSKITSDIISKNLKSNAEYLTTRTVLKIEKVLSTLQRIPENYAEIIQQNEFNEDEINRLLRIMVENNREITGACIAFEPYYKS